MSILSLGCTVNVFIFLSLVLRRRRFNATIFCRLFTFTVFAWINKCFHSFIHSFNLTAFAFKAQHCILCVSDVEGKKAKFCNNAICCNCNFTEASIIMNWHCDIFMWTNVFESRARSVYCDHGEQRIIKWQYWRRSFSVFSREPPNGSSENALKKGRRKYCIYR